MRTRPAPQHPPDELHGPAAAAAAAATTGVAVALGTTHGWRHWVHIYRHHMPRNAIRERLFLAAVAFVTTFSLTRGLTHAIRANIGPFHNVSVGGTHVHHLVYGILILLAVGYLNLVEFGGRSWRSGVGIRLTAVLYGVGAALTLDEFALWLNLADVYWERQGRQSIDAVLVFSSLLVAGICAGPLLRALAWDVHAMMRGLSRAERIAHTEYRQLRHRASVPGEAPYQPIDGPP